MRNPDFAISRDPWLAENPVTANSNVGRNTRSEMQANVRTRPRCAACRTPECGLQRTLQGAHTVHPSNAVAPINPERGARPEWQGSVSNPSFGLARASPGMRPFITDALTPSSVATLHQWHGRAIELEGKRLEEMASRLQRNTLGNAVQLEIGITDARPRDEGTGTVSHRIRRWIPYCFRRRRPSLEPDRSRPAPTRHEMRVVRPFRFPHRAFLEPS